MSGEAASRADLHLSGAQEEFLLKLAGIDVPIEPLYPFGYGLSYTTFQYSELEVLTPEIRLDSELNCRVKVKNTGYGSGKEIYRGKSAGLRGLWRYLYRLGQCIAAESGGERIPAQ